MKFDVNELKTKLDDYFGCRITKEDLGQWAQKAYYDLLTGGYVETEKIVIYPFLKVISSIHLKENDKADVYPCSEESVIKIKDILQGKQDFKFEVEMSVPAFAYKMNGDKSYYDEKRLRFFMKLHDHISQYHKQGCRSNFDIRSDLEEIKSLDDLENTVLHMLKEQISDFLELLFDNDCMKEFGHGNMKLWAGKEEDHLLLKRLLDYLDSYVGNKNFYLLVFYKNGLPTIQLVV